MIDLGRHSILGIRINAVDYEAAVDASSLRPASQPLAVSALAVHGVMTGALDREHRYRAQPARFDRARRSAGPLGTQSAPFR